MWVPPEIKDSVCVHAPTSGLTHLNNVNAYDQRLKKWMGGFVGVATKYLPN